MLRSDGKRWLVLLFCLHIANGDTSSEGYYLGHSLALQVYDRNVGPGKIDESLHKGKAPSSFICFQNDAFQNFEDKVSTKKRKVGQEVHSRRILSQCGGVEAI